MTLTPSPLRALCTALLFTLPSLAQAAFSTGPGSELTLFVFENEGSGSAEASYALDLGLVARDFWVQAQQNGGYSKFIELDRSSDANFAKFLDATSATASQRKWAIYAPAVEKGVVGGSPFIQRELYTTLANAGSAQTQSQNFMAAFQSSAFTAATFGEWLNLYDPANASDVSIFASLQNQASNSTHGSVANGSSFSSKAAADPGYFGLGTAFSASAAGAGTASPGDCFKGFVCIGNSIGQSSWFYKVAAPDPLDEEAGYGNPMLDEFDNGNGTAGHDGYWGFAFNATTNKYVLSYTLAPFTPSALANTAEGRLRLLTTDYSAQSGPSRLIGTPEGEFAGWEAGPLALAPVPEPATWGLMGLGLAVFAFLRTRSKERS